MKVVLPAPDACPLCAVAQPGGRQARHGGLGFFSRGPGRPELLPGKPRFPETSTSEDMNASEVSVIRIIRRNLFLDALGLSVSVMQAGTPSDEGSDIKRGWQWRAPSASSGFSSLVFKHGIFSNVF